MTRYYPDDETFNADDYTTFVPRAGTDGAYLPLGCIHVADDSASAYTMVNVTRLDGDYETASVAVLGGTEQLSYREPRERRRKYARVRDHRQV